MWAAAFLTFLVAPGLGAALLLASAAVTYVKSAKVDAEYAKQGQLPPTQQLVKDWLDRKKAAGTAPADAKVKKYGSWAYAWQRWYAFWEDLGEKHREQRAEQKQAAAEAKKNGNPPPKKPTWRERLAGWKWSIPNLTRPARQQQPDTESESNAGGQDGPRIACDECGVTLADAAGGYQHPPDSTCPKAQRTPGGPDADGTSDTGGKGGDGQQYHWRCDTCRIGCDGFPSQRDAAAVCRGHNEAMHGGTATAVVGPGTCPNPEYTTGTEQASGPACPYCGTRLVKLRHIGLWCPNCDTFHDRRQRRDEEQPADDETPQNQTATRPCAGCGTPLPAMPGIKPSDAVRCANCGPNGPNPTATEGEPMTTTSVSGEVTGTRSAVAYARRMAEAHAQHSGNEGYVTSLQNMEVGSGDIALVQQAMEASQIAAAKWAAAAASIEKNNAALREHYANVPDAASKEANIRE